MIEVLCLGALSLGLPHSWIFLSIWENVSLATLSNVLSINQLFIGPKLAIPGCTQTLVNMNNFTQILKKQFLIGLIVSVISLFSTQAISQCSAPTLKFHSPVLLSGTDHQAGAIYLFQNVIPDVDAHIEIVGLFGGATLYNIDDSTGIGYYDAFQPYVGAAPNDTSYIDWKITFKVAGTDTDTILECLAVTGVDVDGDGAYLQEFIEAATPGSIAIDPFSILQVSFDGVRSKAVSTIYNIALIDTAHHEAMFQMNFTNISTLLYRNGAISTYGAQQIRQTCIYFKPFFYTYMLLPAKIVSFTGKGDADQTKLQWTATHDNELKFYTVQKSTDGKIWKDVQTIHPGSSTTMNSYLVNDMEKNSGATYYRLKQADLQGLVSYSKIIRINNASSNQKIVTHNSLVKDVHHFQIYGTSNDEYTVEYFTVAGAKVKQERFRIYPGINSTSVQFGSDISFGSYFLVMKNRLGEQVYSSRIIKN